MMVNDKTADWIQGQAPAVRTQYNTKCTEAMNDDLSTWRDVGKSVYDYNVSGMGDYRVVAVKSGNDFNVQAIYRHGSSGGKTKVVGATVASYG